MTKITEIKKYRNSAESKDFQQTESAVSLKNGRWH